MDSNYQYLYENTSSYCYKNTDVLINKLNIEESSLISKIKFNIKITLNSGKVFSADNVEIQVPNEGINENGTVGHEYTDLQSIVFKRIEN